MLKIIADDKIPFLRGALEKYATVIYLPGKEIGPEDVKDADALIVRTRTKCNKDLLENSSVRFIATATIGFDHIDTAYCAEKGIVWQNAPGCNSSSVVQYVAAALVKASDYQKKDLKELSLGIVGVGNVGSKLNVLAQHLGMKVFLNDPPRAEKEGADQFCSLENIIENCDIISFHTPLNIDGKYKTFHLADEDFFSKFKNAKVLINSSRGEVVKTNALKQAIKDKKIDFSVIDVWENEPELDRELLGLVNIASPHIAGYSVDGKALGTAMSVQGVARFFNLDLLNWKATNLPEPNEKLISIEQDGGEEAVKRAILHTYHIHEDDKRLRDNPELFEEQRGNYPVRREFPAYKISKSNACLEALGFRK